MAEGVATRQPHRSLGAVQRDLSSGDVAITDPDDPRMTVVIIPWAGEAETFSVRYIGDLDEL